jgi:PilZ domain
MQQERRRSLRFRFETTAEVFRENVQDSLPTRVTEISPNGCYLQMGSPPDVGATILMKVFTEGSFFEARASVVYSQPNMGMGVEFRDMKPYFGDVLKRWLLTAMHAKHNPPG